MCIGTAQRLRRSDTNIDAYIDNEHISNYTLIKLLGVQFDSCLTFAEQVECITKKVMPKIGLIHRLRQFLELDTLKIVYITIIQSIFDNCLTVWGSCASVYLNQIQRLQNRAARAVTGNFNYTDSVSSLIKTLGWMNIRQRHFYFMCILMFKCLNGMAPERLKNSFSYIKNTTGVDTRSARNNLLCIPKPNCEMYRRSLSYVGPKIWNTLPSDLRCITEMHIFKTKLKKHILSNEQNCNYMHN